MGAEPEGPLSRKEAVKAPIKDFADWSSTQGIPRIGAAERYYCVGFWIIVTLVSTGCMIWQLVLIMQNYYSYGVSVAVELKFEQRTFPAITICNLNPYKKSVVQNYANVTRLLNTYMYVMHKVSCAGEPNCYEPNPTYDQYQEMYGFNNVTDTAALQVQARRLLVLEMAEYDAEAAMTSMDEVVQGCSFNTEQCDMQNDWLSYVDPVMGLCFMFNKDSARMAQRAGPIYGLRVILKTNVSEFIATSDTAGIRVMVHDQQEFPFPDIFGYNVPVGRSTSIGVTYQQISRMSAPYGDCTDDKPDVYLYDRDYSTEACQRSRYQTQMVSNCSCYDPSYPKPNDTSVAACKIPDNFDCWSEATKHSKSDNSCTQPCNTGIYQVTVSSSNWPSGPVDTTGQCVTGTYSNTCHDVYKSNGALLEVYYEKLNYETMEESAAYTMTNVFSDAGGQIGLWLGMSLVSVVEFAVVFYQAGQRVAMACIHPKAGESMAF